MEVMEELQTYKYERKRLETFQVCKHKWYGCSLFCVVPAHLLLAADINHSVPIGFLSQLWQYAPQAWPANAKVEAWKMAKAGLRYTGQEEEVHINVQCSACVKIKNLCRGKLWFQKLTGVSSQVTCAWCGCVLGDWQYGDQVCTSSSIYFNAQRN